MARIQGTIFLLFLLIPPHSIAQNITVSGIIKDAGNGDFIPYANLLINKSNIVSQSNDLGYFNFKTSTRNIEIIISALGYETDTFDIEINKDTTIHFELITFSLPDIVITDNALLQVRHAEIQFTPDIFKKSNFILGEPDILKSVQLYGGVSVGIEASTQYSVRGGDFNQNAVLLDGSILYNTSHLFGFVSTVDANVVKSATFYKGSFPIQYGNRLSSVLDISLKEGNKYKANSKLSIGLINASYFREGPIIKGKSSYMIGLRTAFPGLFTQNQESSFNKRARKSYFAFYMGDINFKINTDIGKNNRLFFSAYKGNDDWKNGFYEMPIFFKWRLKWGNEMMSVKWHSILNSSSALTTQFNYNKFNYTSQTSTQMDLLDLPDQFINKSAINDFKLGTQLVKSLSNRAKLTMGTDITQSNVAPTVNFLSNSSLKPTSKLILFNFTSYIGLNSEITSANTIDLGFRYNYFYNKEFGRNQFDPRLKLINSNMKRINLFASYMITHQNLHLISNTTNGYVTDVWIPATKTLVPQKMSEIAIGFETVPTTRQDYFNINLFYRLYSGLSVTRSDINAIRNDVESWEDLLAKNGKGRSLGVEGDFYVSYKRFSLLSSLTLSRSFRTFNEIDKGSEFPADADRPVIINSNISYRRSEKTIYKYNLTISSGRPVTTPTYAALREGINSSRAILIYSNRNNGRFPTYFRSDIGFLKQFKRKSGKINELNVSVYNILLNKNYLYIEFSPVTYFKDRFSTVDPILQTIIDNRTSLQFIPGIYFTYEW